MPTRHRPVEDSGGPPEAGGSTGQDSTARDHETALAPPQWDLLPPTELLQRHRRGDTR